MITLTKKDLSRKEDWQSKGIELPKFDIEKVTEKTKVSPEWIHFGAGNIFRAFVADIAQEAIEKDKMDTGIITAFNFDFQILEKIYKPFDNLTLQVILNSNGNLTKKVIASVTESLNVTNNESEDFKRTLEIFKNSSLKMVSFTITEKGYHIQDMNGDYYEAVKEDFQKTPEKANTAMAVITYLLHERFLAGKAPLAMVSMDNFSHNGDKLKDTILKIASNWKEKGVVTSEFVEYLSDKNSISFPLTMIDKITPRPSEQIAEDLKNIGIENMDIVITDKNTYIAPFVNAEKPQYLVMEDSFPNGKIDFSSSNGVFYTTRDTVDKIEKMKVCTCLNPLHTALAIFGCLLGFDSIAAEMKDESLRKLVERIGYDEGMPVVIDPKIIDPKQFINEVLTERFPNAYILDTPQRIATDTSQKLGIRFGETIKLYEASETLDTKTLKFIPIVIAGWCRYLMAIGDDGKVFEVSPDPLYSQVFENIKHIKLGDETIGDSLKLILSNERIFGVNLYNVGLGEKIENYFVEMIKEVGAVRKLLVRELS